MSAARWAALAVIGAIVIGLVGCGGDEKGTDVSEIAIVTPGTRDDAELTQRTVAAVRRVAKRFNATAVVVDGSKGDVAAAIERVAEDAQLVVVPYGGDRATAVRLAAEHEVPTLVWGDPDAARPDLVGNVEVDWRGGAYAAGFLASHGSYFKGVGAVVCADGTKLDLAERYAMAAAYFAGARADNPKVKLAYAPAGEEGRTTNDEAVQATLRTIRDGAQMVLGACGAASFGVFDGTIRAGGETLFVGLVGEQPIDEENANNIVTSVLMNPTAAIAQAVRDVRTGRFGRRSYVVDFASGGLSLLATGRTPSDAHEEGVKASKRVAEGSVELPDVTTERELRDYMAR